MDAISTDQWWLVVACITMTAIAAAGVYEAFFVMPKWFADVPKSLALMRQRTAIWFWLPLQIVTLAAVIGGAIANWHVQVAHNSLLVGVVSYALVWITTFVFFVPGVARFNKVDLDKPAAPGLAEAGKRWLNLSWFRQVAMVVSAISLVITVAAL